MKPRTLNRLLALYVLIAILTFGHSWVFSPIPKNITDWMMLQGIASFSCSALWPCYWSVKFFQLFEPR